MDLIQRRASIERREIFENLNRTLLDYGYHQLTVYGDIRHDLSVKWFVLVSCNDIYQRPG